MIQNIHPILNALEDTPRLLKELLSEIDPELYKLELVKGKWSIHENATHIAVTDRYGFQNRLNAFKTQEQPIIKPLSGDNFEKDFFLKLDLNRTVDAFYNMRQQTIALARAFNENDWHKLAVHPEYKTYTPYIMLRHLLMHDHSHLYKIEDMGFGIGHVK